MVLAADRQYTAGDQRFEGRISKKREIGYGWRFLYQDNGTRADELAEGIHFRLTHKDQPTPMPATHIRFLVQQEFHDLLERNRELGILDDPNELDLGLLLVGFDEHNEAAGFEIFANGDYETIREVGYGVIGSGKDAAVATLAHYGVVMDDPLWRVLYKVYEAKRRAERMITSVGTSTDMWVMTEHARRQSIFGDDGSGYLTPPAGPIVVPDHVLNVLSVVFDWTTAPPWQRPEEPMGWTIELMGYANALMRGENPQ